MSKLKIRNKIYTVTDCKDELTPSKDGRPWIQEFYELLDEEGETKYMWIWSDDSFELADKPLSAKPEIEGMLSEIEEVKDGTI
ncbi:unnamed protein product [marine sediment metagenome]|uniref:Uncharacterized protein n=1 Tax=marine sediment metagenome TaxID=412755 RepID=X0U030_9ZZZZ